MTTDDVYRLKRMHAIDPPEKAWKQFSPLFDLIPLRMANNSGAIENHTWIAGSSIFSQVSLDGNLHDHGEHHLIRSGDLLFVHRYLSGGAGGRSGDTPYMMRPGMMIFHDYGGPFEGIQLPSTIQSVYFRHDLIGYDPSSMPPQIMFDQNTPHGAALFSTFDELMPELLNGCDVLEKARVGRLADEVKAVLHSPDSEMPDRMKVQLYIEENLTDAELDESQIQSAFEMSRAQLFELLLPYGGFAQYVDARRTFHAIRDLHQNTERRARLEETARRWGFPSGDELRRTVARIYLADLNTIFPD